MASNSKDWGDFFTLLRSLFTKEETGIVPTESNFNPYLVRRYLSFYHPNLLLFIADTVNDNKKFSTITSSDVLYKTLKAIIPKLPYHKIEYIKKPVSQKLTNTEENFNEKVEQLANYLEISKREVLFYLAEFDPYDIDDNNPF